MSEWVEIKEKLPKFGEPVILTINGYVQGVTYVLDAGEDEGCAPWFQPHYFYSTDECKIRYHKVSHWMPLPEPPNV